jgi:hypothetical protein
LPWWICSSARRDKVKAEYKFHPIADIFPLMSKEERNLLATDIKANGLQVPIVSYGSRTENILRASLRCISR